MQSRDSRLINKSTNKVTTKKKKKVTASLLLSLSFCFLLLQLERQCSSAVASDKPYAIKTPPNLLDPGKAQTKRRCCALPRAQGYFLAGSHRSKDMYGHFRSIHQHQRWRGVNTCIILWATHFNLATRDLELGECDSLYCILICMYVYIYRYNTILVNKVAGFHMADRGTELRVLLSPQTCLVNSSFCYIVLSSQISIMQPFCFHPQRNYSHSMYTFIAGFFSQ